MDIPLITTTIPQVQKVIYVAEQCNLLYEHYKELIDSFVLDFFTCTHWDMLPSSWKKYFNDITPEEMSNILDFNQKLHRSEPAPLSLITLRSLIHYLSIPRSNLQDTPLKKNETNKSCKLLGNAELMSDGKIMKMFWKHVKIKKRYELMSFAQYTYQMAIETNCQIVVDVGAGLGHLCRLLSYGYGMQVIGIDAQDQLVQQAKLVLKLDEDLERLALKYKPDFMKYNKYSPCHIKLIIKDDLNRGQFLEILKIALNLTDNNFRFGIVGLHPCGDLGPILLGLYRACPNVQFINVVGCCYMKLTSGYPLSRYYIKNQYNLSYHAREIACHAMEIYIEKLKSGNHWELKVHAYRATLEKIISDKYPQLKHIALANVKYTPEMTFSEYCQKALRKLEMTLMEKEVCSEEIEKCLDDWKRVVTFYSIRLLFAPLIETLITLDRYLYIRESGRSIIKTIFDPKLSPRNFVITGLKI